MKHPVSEINALKKENLDLKRQLENVQKDMQASLSAISHELRNSLTLIIGSIQLVEQDYPDITSCPHWPGIRSDLNHMQAFLQDVSSYKSLQSIELNRRLCDLTAFLQDMNRNCQTWFDGTHRKLILSCPEKPVTLYADTAKLYQAFTNLIKNGLEVLGTEGTVSLCLRKASEKETETLGTETIAIEIKDTGSGLLAEEQAKIFQPFYTSKPSGTGLGLPIARNIIESHGGTIKVSSVPGKGSVFTVLLPRFPDVIK